MRLELGVELVYPRLQEKQLVLRRALPGLHLVHAVLDLAVAIPRRGVLFAELLGQFVDVIAHLIGVVVLSIVEVVEKARQLLDFTTKLVNSSP